MNINEFWEIIENGKNSDNPEDVLKTQLRKLSPDQIHAYTTYFNNMFDNAYRWDIWCAAYLLGGGGCSDDGFTYFVRGLIAKGREIYDVALDDPNILADFLDAPCFRNEEFGYAARDVYEEITGTELPRHDHPDCTLVEWPSEYSMSEDAWDFEDELENRKRLPGLCALYYAEQ